MPRANWMSDEDFRLYERCLKDLEGKKGINKYAVCMAAIKKRNTKRSAAKEFRDVRKSR